jgi:integrase-like protein
MPRTKNTRGEWSTTRKHVVDEGIRPYTRKPRKNAKAPGKLYQAEKGYQILWTCGRGHRHKEWFRYLDEARSARENRRARVRQGPGWCPREEHRQLEAARRQQQAQAITVRQYAEHWLSAHVAHECRERTDEQYRSTFKHHVYPTLGDVPLGELKRSHVKTLMATKAAAGLGRNTLKNILIPLRAMLNAAVDEERIAGNPAVRVLKRKRGQTESDARKVTTWSEEELAKALGAADEHCPDHADMVYVLAWTGLP